MTTKVTEADIPKILATIRARESNNNYTAHAGKGSASGAYQFIDSTWRSNAKAAGVDISQYPTAASAPPAIQDQVASANVRNILQAHGWDAEAVPAAWYLGHVPAAGSAEWDSVPAPQFGNTATPRNYVSSWMKTFNGTVLPMSGTASKGATTTANLSPADIAAAASQYGYAAAYLKDPELGPILIQAAKEQWTSAKLEAAIADTNWYKSSTASVRTFQNLAARDPATAQAEIATQQATLTDQANQLGLSIDPARMKNIAWEALSFGWNQNQITDALAAESHYDPGKAAQGQIGYNQSSVKALASKYYLSISDQDSFNYAKQLVDGSLNQQGLESMFINQSKGKFPTLSKYIDMGITPDSFFAPYKAEAARLLDVPSSSIDLANDPRYSKVLSMAGSDGTLRPMSISEFQTMIRNSPQWDKTRNATDAAAALGESLTKAFGAVK